MQLKGKLKWTQLLCIRMKSNEFNELKDNLRFLFERFCRFIEGVQAVFHVFGYGNEYQIWPNSNHHEGHREKIQIK